MPAGPTQASRHRWLAMDGRAAARDRMTGHDVFKVGTGIATRLDALYAMICESFRKAGLTGLGRGPLVETKGDAGP